MLEHCDWYQNSGVKGKHNCSMFVRVVIERNNKLSFVMVVKGGECLEDAINTKGGYCCNI